MLFSLQIMLTNNNEKAAAILGDNNASYTNLIFSIFHYKLNRNTES